MPGAIDVRFISGSGPYLQKIESESRALPVESPSLSAATVPNAVTQEILEENIRWLLRDRMRIIRL
jgi:hypothetical protein